MTWLRNIWATIHNKWVAYKIKRQSRNFTY